MKTLKVLLSMCLLVLAAAPTAWAQQGGHMWGGGGWMFMGPVTMILFLAAIIAVIVFVIRGAGSGSSGRSPKDREQPSETPLDILKKRYARGEIGQAEFEEIRRAITE
ncbi:MAG: SHOCT domain-containing protein [Rhodospirillales bacterium]|nr:SHOCT domain-containing protein [Rhodospirillales bacterium]